MADAPEPHFNPTEFSEPDTYQITDREEFSRQITELLKLKRGDVALEFISGALSDTEDEDLKVYLIDILVDIANDEGNLDALTLHGQTLAELYEESGSY